MVYEADGLENQQGREVVSKKVFLYDLNGQAQGMVVTRYGEGEFYAVESHFANVTDGDPIRIDQYAAAALLSFRTTLQQNGNFLLTAYAEGLEGPIVSARTLYRADNIHGLTGRENLEGVVIGYGENEVITSLERTHYNVADGYHRESYEYILEDGREVFWGLRRYSKEGHLSYKLMREEGGVVYEETYYGEGPERNLPSSVARFEGEIADGKLKRGSYISSADYEYDLNGQIKETIEVNYGESKNYCVKRIFNGSHELVGLSVFESKDRLSEIKLLLDDGDFSQEIYLLPDDDNYPTNAEGLVVAVRRIFKGVAMDIPDESQERVKETINHFLDGAFIGRSERRFDEGGFLAESAAFDENDREYLLTTHAGEALPNGNIERTTDEIALVSPNAGPSVFCAIL
jgi:hypothetical protein